MSSLYSKIFDYHTSEQKLPSDLNVDSSFFNEPTNDSPSDSRYPKPPNFDRSLKPKIEHLWTNNPSQIQIRFRGTKVSTNEISKIFSDFYSKDVDIIQENEDTEYKKKVTKTKISKNNRNFFLFLMHLYLNCTYTAHKLL